MKAYFELDDKGTCNRFTLIKGVQRTHTFIQSGAGGSKLHFEGSHAEFNFLMKDIYAMISPIFRTKAIFVYVEMPDVEGFQTIIRQLTEDRDLLRRELDVMLTPPAVTHPFPLTLPVDNQPDVGLPVGPVNPVTTLSKAEATKAKRAATWARKKAEAAKAKVRKPKQSRRQTVRA
jgi:hypothetical protein